ncbi:MAG: hypothetical protein ABS76_24535 [Pelagibacterium sp. SCN 64-44]|nr:MAG: hypothetical protein ABS76_24535 [Pelagibacterium sp. SCN 64-44]
MFKTGSIIAGLLVAGLLGAAPAMAQLSLDDIEKQMASGQTELDRVDALLSIEDANQRITAMGLLLQTGNPVYIRRALQLGLLSSDPDMQLEALKARLDAGGPLRFEVDMTALSGDGLKAWTRLMSGEGTVSVDGKQGTFILDMAGFDTEKRCYVQVGNSRYCLAQIAGAKVSFPLANWSRVQGVAALGPDGALTGEFNYDGYFAPVRIPLVE